MSVFFSLGGNWSSASSWAIANSTAESDSEATSTALTTSYQTSSTFTPGAIQIDAIAVKVASRAASPSGTMTVALDQAGSDVASTVVTVNVSDLDAAGNGWHLFKFASPVTLSAATAYSVKAKTTVAAQVNLYSTATTNWSRELRTTTTGTPASNDKVIIVGELTGAGTGNNITQTVDSDLSAVSLGTTALPQTIHVAKRGTLSFSTSSSANPKIKFKGIAAVYGGGTINMGTSGTVIPANSTAELIMDVAANVDTGIVVQNGGTFNAYGYAKKATQVKLTSDIGGYCTVNTGGLGVTRVQGPSFTSLYSNGNTVVLVDAAALGSTVSKTSTSMTGDSFTWAAGALTVGKTYGYKAPTMNSITVANLDGTAADLSDWTTSDTVAVAATGRLGNECETSGISSINNTTKTVTLSGSLLYPHLTMSEVGSQYVRCEVVNITRNVKIHGASSSLQGYILVSPTATINLSYAELYYLGSATASKRGIDLQTTSGSINIQYCALHDFGVTSSIGLNFTGVLTGSATISNNVSFSISNSHLVASGTTSTSNYAIENNVFLKQADVAPIINVTNCNGALNNNTAVGSQQFGFTINSTSVALTSFTGNVAHACVNNAFNTTSILSVPITNVAAWRNTQSGLGSISTAFSQNTITSPVLFGNAATNLFLTSTTNVVVTNALIAGDLAFASTLGVTASGQPVIFENCSIGMASGYLANHTTADISCTSTSTTMIFRNTSFGSPTTVTGLSNLGSNCYFGLQKVNGTAGNHRFYLTGGTGSTDTSIFSLSSPSLRLTPNSASTKMTSAPYNLGVGVPVLNGNSATVSVYVRKSSAADGGAYNGNQPRLIVRRNVTAQINADTVLATASAARGVWEQLSGTTPVVSDDSMLEIIVDCDGTVGWVNVDRFAVS